MKQLTLDQENALKTINEMISGEICHIAILKGFAGTGKTTLMTAVIKQAQIRGFEVRCMAPTNSAAINFSRRTGYKCNTIHHSIFSHHEEEERVIFKRKYVHRAKNVLFVVDEASMVPNQKPIMGENFITPGPLLEELIIHGREHCENPKFLFAGDNMQLPPLFEGQSDALCIQSLEKLWPESLIQETQLTSIMRQNNGSPILTYSERCIDAIQSLEAYDKRDALQIGMPILYDNQVATEVAEYNEGNSKIEATIITFSNKEVQFMNQKVRNQLGRNWGVLAEGDHLTLHQSCIVEGEIFMKGERIFITMANEGIEEWCGCQFQQVRFIKENNEREFSAKFNLTVIFSEKGNLDVNKEKQMKHHAMKYNARYRNSLSPQHDEHIGAVRARFAYATTCHKAQGQQFTRVYISPIWGRGDHQEKWQWFYTAITRATDQVFGFNLFLPN